MTEERFLFLWVKIGAEKKSPKAGNASIFQTVLRHVFHRLLKAEEAGPNPRALSEAHILLDVCDAARPSGLREQLTLHIAREINSLLPIAKSGTEGVGRLRLGDARKDRRRADRAAVVHAALDVVS